MAEREPKAGLGKSDRTVHTVVIDLMKYWIVEDNRLTCLIYYINIL